MSLSVDLETHTQARLRARREALREAEGVLLESQAMLREKQQLLRAFEGRWDARAWHESEVGAASEQGARSFEGEDLEVMEGRPVAGEDEPLTHGSVTLHFRQHLH